jgi:hypothetical protein
MNLTQEQLKQIAEYMATYKASGTNPVNPPAGPYGLFTTPGLMPDIPSTYVAPEGFEGFLEAQGHVRVNKDNSPIYGIMTGLTASTGEEPTQPCDENVRVAGNLKFCQMSLPYGELTMKSQVMRLDNAGILNNRGQSLDLRLINNPFNQELASQLGSPNPQDIFRSTVAKTMLELATGFKRDYANLIWNGNPSNTTGSTGGYIEWNGLNRLINTGYQDVITSARCASADSLVHDFGDAIIQNNAGDAVRWFIEVYRDRQYLAQQVRLSGVQWAWVMRRQLFLALTDVWPCAYNTFRCYNAAPNVANTVISLDGNQQNAMREQMRAGSYLMIDGVAVPVIIDNTLDETNHANGNFSSNAYLVPLRANSFSETGGQLTYIEYFDYRNDFGMVGELERLGIAMSGIYKVSPDGRFVAMIPSPTAFCVQIMMRTMKRIVLRTPFLAARIDNLQYNVYLHERDYNASSSFYVNGGNTSYTPPSFYPPFAS